MTGLNAVHLNGLRAVEAVARCGSLLKAADELGVSPSAVSQQVGRTEKQIGRTLFARTREGLAPTEFGNLFAARLAAGFRELARAVALADDSAAHTLVASVAPAFASRWLVPRLSRFYARHPELALRIDATTRLVDFSRSDVDLAIRMGDGQWPGAQAELLLALEIFPVCAPAIAKRLKTIADLAKEWAICDENSMFTWDRWFATAYRRSPCCPAPASPTRCCAPRPRSPVRASCSPGHCWSPMRWRTAASSRRSASAPAAATAIILPRRRDGA
jgi:LysR family glycine cleavage system transcriptional activator